MRIRRQPSTRYAILGLLSLAPMSGYEIRKVAASSIGHFWSESYGQIYPTLRKLVAAGLAKPRSRRGRQREGGRRDRQEFEITEKGRAVLAEWRAAAPRAQPPRNELLLKLFFGERVSIEEHVAHVQAVLAHETDQVDRYRQLELRIRQEWRRHPSCSFWLMTVRHGRRVSDALVRWSRETLTSLKREGTMRNAGPRPRVPKRKQAR